MKRNIRRQQRKRRGVSLMEVLISTFVLSIGLLGLAALLPIGNVAILAASKADRGGACARAGLSYVKTYRLLDSNRWTSIPSSPSFAVDPLGLLKGSPTMLGPLERVGMAGWNLDMAEHVFLWHDDWQFDMPRDVSLRPTYDPAKGLQEQGHYSWFLTGAASPVDPQVFNVSVVVCYRRDFPNEQVSNAKVQSGGWGGGRVKLMTPLEVKDDSWIMLTDGVTARWYRIVGAGGRPAQFVELTGPDCPDWDGLTIQAVVIRDVVGVSTATVELDRFSIWNQ